MPSFPKDPLVRPREGGLQLSYRLQHRVYAAKGYPLRAPNGSSIIIYGGEKGLKVVWRGGRQFSELKSPETPRQDKNASDNGGDAVMIIDSDDEDEAESQSTQGPTYDFISQESEVDPSFPFEPILRQVDIPLGCEILDLAIPRVLSEESRSALDPFPPILKTTIVVAIVCADLSIRVVTLPLCPPHPNQTDPELWQTECFPINPSHQEFPRGISITFTCQEVEEDEDHNSRGRPGKWDLFVATHSAEGSGVLLLHRIPIREESSGEYRFVAEETTSQKRLLPSPAQRIAFNPSAYTSARHSNLLVAFHSGCVKVYSCFSIKKPLSVARRSSNAQEEYQTLDMEGRWLISLYPGFAQGSTGFPRRKTIIDADWVLGGQAIMVLLMDGEWGVWDIEGTGPGATKGPLHRQANVQGVSGGSITAYAVSGRIATQPSNTQSETEQRPRFAPMTPSTKRVREDTLLKGSLRAANPSLRGQISVFQTNSSQEALPDESILLRHGLQSAVIPSLLSLWRSAVRSTGTLDASNRCRVTPFQDVNIMGENFQAISHLPAPVRRSRANDRPLFDVLVAAEHQIMILAPRLTESQEIQMTQAKSETTIEDDQKRLRQGELDVEGMGRLLNGMATGSVLNTASPVKRARIFA